jgi:hypothetical protein
MHNAYPNTSAAGTAAGKIPTPAHPHQRKQPLPGHEPKSAADDPEARIRVQAIMASDNYRIADHDVAFLDQSESRGVRLQLDCVGRGDALGPMAIGLAR